MSYLQILQGRRAVVSSAGAADDPLVHAQHPVREPGHHRSPGRHSGWSGGLIKHVTERLLRPVCEGVPLMVYQADLQEGYVGPLSARKMHIVHVYVYYMYIYVHLLVLRPSLLHARKTWESLETISVYSRSSFFTLSI